MKSNPRRNVFGTVLLAVMAVPGASGQEAAAKQEIGLTLGRLAGQTRSGSATRLDLGSGAALQANYGYKIAGGVRMALYAEFHLLANGQRRVMSEDRNLTRDVATLYATPGIRLKLFPLGRVSPYATIGSGYALYEQSLGRLNGQDNAAPRYTHRGAFTFGGGADIPLWRFVHIRGEVRDFYSGSPSFNTPAISGGQHNAVLGGGFALHFR